MLITIEAYIEKTFAPGSEPHPSTVRRWIESGKLNGQKMGGRWYVKTDEPTNDPRANEILRKHGH